MIDLKTKGLPNGIEIGGTPFLLDTDFRVWMTFPERIGQLRDGEITGYRGLFLERYPTPGKAVIEALGRFYRPPREVPRAEETSERLLDLDIDADYVYAAFQQAYGIDLTEADMHWHKVSALLAAVPQGTTLTDIIGYRSYKGSSKDPLHKEHMKLKGMWALPQPVSDDEKEAIEEFNKLFG